MKFTTFPENINPFQKKGIVKFGIDPTGSEMQWRIAFKISRKIIRGIY